MLCVFGCYVMCVFMLGWLLVCGCLKLELEIIEVVYCSWLWLLSVFSVCMF